MKKALKRHSSSSKNTRRTVRIRVQTLWVTICSILTVAAVGLFVFRPGTPCANSGSCQTDLSEKIENGESGTFMGRTIPAPEIGYSAPSTRKVLGSSDTTAEKHIYVDLSAQKLFAFEGDKQVFETLVATGRWGKTPTGNFHIWSKLRSTRMSGGSGSDYYDLPNVPYVMYFYHDFGLHGAYWHDNFGHTMSHGCVNLRQIDAETLFNWADGPSKGVLGTAVSICDRFSAPNMCEQDNPVAL